VQPHRRRGRGAGLGGGLSLVLGLVMREKPLSEEMIDVAEGKVEVPEYRGTSAVQANLRVTCRRYSSRLRGLWSERGRAGAGPRTGS
jgi:hypothetical protein